MPVFDLKNIRTWDSRNGYGMSATLLVDGVIVCEFYDVGDGSQPNIDVKVDSTFNELNRKINALPELFHEEYGCEIKINIYLFIDLLHYALETKTEFKLLAA